MPTCSLACNGIPTERPSSVVTSDRPKGQKSAPVTGAGRGDSRTQGVSAGSLLQHSDVAAVVIH